MQPSARDLDLRQHHGVETPEHVDVRFELAGIGSRMAAALLDLFILWISMMVLTFVYSTVSSGWAGEGRLGGWVAALLILLFFLLFWGYFTLFEALNGGRTLGKQALGIRVVMDTGRPVTPTAAVIRNLVRPLDCYFPIPFAPAMLGMLLHPSNKRPGDMVAGTIVVRDRPTDWVLGVRAVAAGPAVPEAIEAGPPELSEDEFRLLDRYLSRINELAPDVQRRIGTDLARRFEPRIPRRAADTPAYLIAVFAEEQRRRRSRFATRAQGPGRTTVTAERFLAKKRDAWEAFRAVAVRMERSGVGALSPSEIPAFAAQYREIAADLARARSYRVDARVIEYLERVVSAGHNALYRARGKERTPLGHYLLREFPAAVMASWRYVVLAFVLFTIPGVIGYIMIRERPELAEELVSPVMVSRAEQAAARQAEGEGYAETAEAVRPVLAAAIITNNLQVSFGVFVGGITGGLLTAWLLFYNGMLIGLGLGLFKNYDALGYLVTFVIGHGILELVAIFISAGAGFRLAKALIAPGDRTRRDALVVEGRIAVRMIGAVVTLLAIAGAIEGLLSASAAPPAWKYGVSAATIVFLVLYLLAGVRYLKQRSTTL